jgi:prepilin-type N-terminal cleavage/methylation domain-containing protein
MKGMVLNKAFTLVEVIVAISVIAILASLVTIGFGHIQADARDSQRNVSTTTLAEALEKYYDKNGEYPSCSVLTASVSTVQQALDITSNILKTPNATTDNSIVCTDITSQTDGDVFAYVGDGSTSCSTGASCLQYTLKYKEEATGEVVSIESRRKVGITTSGGTTLTATPNGQTAINLSWTAVQNSLSYTVQRSTTNTFPTGVSTVTTSETTTTKAQTGLRPGTTYYFRLQSVASTGTGQWTDPVAAATDNIPAPSITAASQTSGRNGIALTLSNSTGANAYSIQRATNSSFSSGLVTFTSSTNSYTDSTAVIGTSYYYRAKATNTNNGGDSGWGTSRAASIPWVCSDKGYVGTYPNCSLTVQGLYADTYKKCAVADDEGESQLYCWGNGRDANSDVVLAATRPQKMNTSAKGNAAITSVSLGQRLCYTAGGGAYCAADAGQVPSRVTSLSSYNVTKIVVAGFYTASTGTDTRYQCAVASGGLYCWGWNSYGQVGDGTTTDVASPKRVGGLLSGKTVTDVSIDLQSTCAIASGQLYCWGIDIRNPMGNFQRDYAPSSVPVLAAGLSGYTATSVDLRNQQACVTTTVSKVLCYGNGEIDYDSSPYTRYGSSTSPIRTSATVVPVTQGILPTKDAVAVGGDSWSRCTLVTNNNVYCWGEGGGGVLGNGATDRASSPVQVVRTGVLNGKTITDLVGNCVIADSEVYCWGYGAYGALGNGSTSNRSEPVKANIAAPAF